MQVLLDALNQISDVTESLQQFLFQKVEVTHLKRNEFLFKQGIVAPRLYFVSKGLLRSYVVEDNREATVAFVKERQILVSVLSFYHQMPSREFAQTIENSEIMSISNEDLEYCYKNFPESNGIAREVMKKSFIEI